MRTIRIFVSSPGDVHLERLKASEVIDRVQGEVSAHAKLEPYFWEHEPMLATKDFQENIASPAEFDIVLCILWCRLGSRLHAKYQRDDGSRYLSGTEFEFEEAVRGWRETNGDKPDILVYRRNHLKFEMTDDRLELAAERMRQYQAVLGFFDKWFRSPDEAVFIGAYNRYENLAQFELKLYRAVRALVLKRLPKEAENARMRATWSHGSPFRGLHFFDFEHGPVFYGRSRAVDEIIGLMRRRAEESIPFVLVFGSSGVGKSSLIRAGVLPQLVKPGVIEGIGHWRYAIFRSHGSTPTDSTGNGVTVSGRSGTDLYLALARILMQAGALGDEFSITEQELADLLQTNPAAAADAIKVALGLAAERHQQTMQLESCLPAKLVLVIDQMEELFTSQDLTVADRGRFMKAIDELIRTGQVWVLATLRSDFFPRCETIPELMRLKQGNGQYHLQMPEEYEISQMIRWPAAAAGLRFAEDIQKGERLEDLIRDAALANRESLPLLQFALEELYHRRTSDDVLTLEAYREIGGVEGSLAKRAETEWQEFVSEYGETISDAAFDAVLKRLVTVSADERENFSRRWSHESPATANASETALIERFIRARLFVADVSESGTPMVSLAHEALLQHWQRLRHWLDTNQEDLRTLVRVRGAAATWVEKDRSTDYLLQAEKPLAEAKDLLARNRPALSGIEITFIELSAEAARAELERKADEARQRAEREAAHAQALQKSLDETQAAKTEADSAAKRATTARGEAEKLVQFMTFDLHRKLEAIGKLDLLKDVNLRVEAYYQVFGTEDDDIESLRRRAVTAHHRGDILRGQGDLAGALAAHREGLEINERLLERHPSETERNAALMHYVQVGGILYRLGRLDEAFDAYRRPIEIYGELDLSDPSSAPWRKFLCLALVGRAQVFASKNLLPPAAADYERAAALCEEQMTATDGSGWRQILWPAQAGLGQTRFDQGNISEAIQWHRRAVDTILALIKAEPDSIGFEYDLFGERVRLSQILAMHGEEALAAKELDEARHIAEKLVAHDPTNAPWKNGLAMTHLYRGDLWRRQNNSDAALAEFGRAQEIFDALVSADPQNAEFVRYQKMCRTKTGEILMMQGQRDSILEVGEPSASGSLEPDAAAGQYAEVQLQQIQAKIMAAEGQLRAGLIDAALMGYLEVLPSLENLGAPAGANVRVVEALGSLLAHLGAAFLAKGTLQEAKEALRRCAAIYHDRLLPLDSENQHWQNQLCKCEGQLGAVLFYAGDSDGALRAYLSASTLCEQLVRKQPHSADLQLDLSGIYAGLGDVLAKRKDMLGARQAFHAAIKLAKKIGDADPANAIRQTNLAGYWTLFAEALLVEKEPAEALDAYRQALAVWEKQAGRERNNPLWETQIALICFRMGTLIAQLNRLDFSEAREKLTRCQKIMTRLQRVMALNVEQQNLLRSCEKALMGLPVG